MKPAVTTISLLVANILFLSYILLIDRKRPDTPEGMERDFNLGLKANQSLEVRSVVLRSDEGEAEIVKQADGSWRFVAPFEDRFDPKLMAVLLEDAEAVRINQTISAKEIKKNGWDDKYFGFNEGSVKVEFFAEGGESLVAFELGGPTPYQGTVYARRLGEAADGAVYNVRGYLRDTISEPFDALRDPRLIFAKVDDVFRVKFRPPPAGTLEVHCDKGPDGRWRMEHPLKARCDQELIEELIGDLAKLEVAEFVDQPDADMEAAFDENRYEIVLRQRTLAEDNAKLTVEFGKVPADDADPYVLARVSDRDGIFRVDKRVHYNFGMNGNSLRDRTLADFDYNAVSGVTVKRKGAEPIILKRYGPVWALHRDPANPKNIESANGRMVKELIEQINNEEIVRFASDAAADLELYNLHEPAIEVVINREYIDPNEVVEEGKEPTKIKFEDTLMLAAAAVTQETPEAYAAFKGEHYVYKIANILPPKIARKKASDFRTLQLWPRFFPADLRQVTIADRRSADDPLVLDYDHERNLWQATRGGEDVTGEIDRLVLDGYLQYVGRPPRGEDWVEATLDAELLLNDPDVTVTLSIVDPQDKKTPRSIKLIASATNDAAKYYFGRVNRGRDVVFIKGETIRALLTPLNRLNRASP